MAISDGQPEPNLVRVKLNAAGFATTFLAQYSYTGLVEANHGKIIYNSIRYLIGQYISSVLALKGFSNLTTGRE
jgi:hypothetical protein